MRNTNLAQGRTVRESLIAAGLISPGTTIKVGRPQSGVGREIARDRATERKVALKLTVTPDGPSDPEPGPASAHGGLTPIETQTDVDKFEVVGFSHDADEELEEALEAEGFFDDRAYLHGQALAEAAEEVLGEPSSVSFEDNGMIVDIETGEILGLVQEQFAVDDRASADWVLGKMLAEEAAMAAVDLTEAVIHARAILANAEALKKEKQRRLDYLHYRFDGELGEFARVQMNGSPSRTFKTINGSISLRSVKGGLRVKDEASALDTANRHGWSNAVKVTEKFLISQLTPQQKQLARSIAGHTTAFEIVPDRETVTIKTGVTGMPASATIDGLAKMLADRKEVA